MLLYSYNIDRSVKGNHVFVCSVNCHVFVLCSALSNAVYVVEIGLQEMDKKQNKTQDVPKLTKKQEEMLMAVRKRESQTRQQLTQVSGPLSLDF